MSFKSDLYAYLTGVSALTTIVGTRIYPNFMTDPNSPRPYITYTLSTNENVDHLLDPSSLVRQTLQFDIWADAAVQSWDIQTQLRKALDGYRGTMNSATVVREVRLTSIFENVDGPNDGGNAPAHRLTMEFAFWYIRTTQGFS